MLWFKRGEAVGKRRGGGGGGVLFEGRLWYGKMSAQHPSRPPDYINGQIGGLYYT